MNRPIFCPALAAPMLIAALPVFAGPVNINQASADELAAELTGVGHARASAIVAYRKIHGRFDTAEDLANVEGIGLHIIEINRDNIRLADPVTTRNQ